MIREYRPSDLPELLDVWYRASRVAHPFLDEAFLERERRDIETQWIPVAETWVFEDETRVAGFIALVGSEVGAIFVDPPLHGRGIGRRLMDHARDLRGELEVEVFEANAIGRAFYDAYGFEFAGRSIHRPTGQVMLRLKLDRA